MLKPNREVVDPNQQWSRGKLLALAVGVAIGFVVVVMGLVLALSQALRPPSAAPSASPLPTAAGSATVVGGVRDAAAAAPLPSSAASSGELLLPQPSRLGGVGGVASGFPHTGEGAVAQLADIDLTVLSTMRPEVARSSYQAWALPGGVGADAWILTVHVEAFQDTLARAGLNNPTVTASPAAGMITATDGPDWVIACVLMDVRATLRTEARLGWGHCERMQWADGRWQIAPGVPPTQPDSVTLGAPAATAAGWRPIRTVDSLSREQVAP